MNDHGDEVNDHSDDVNNRRGDRANNHVYNSSPDFKGMLHYSHMQTEVIILVLYIADSKIIKTTLLLMGKT